MITMFTEEDLINPNDSLESLSQPSPFVRYKMHVGAALRDSETIVVVKEDRFLVLKDFRATGAEIRPLAGLGDWLRERKERR